MLLKICVILSDLRYRQVHGLSDIVSVGIFISKRIEYHRKLMSYALSTYRFIILYHHLNFMLTIKYISTLILALRSPLK